MREKSNERRETHRFMWFGINLGCKSNPRAVDYGFTKTNKNSQRARKKNLQNSSTKAKTKRQSQNKEANLSKRNPMPNICLSHQVRGIMLVFVAEEKLSTKKRKSKEPRRTIQSLEQNLSSDTSLLCVATPKT